MRNATHKDETYRDTGCYLHPSCLACPREVCIHDETQESRFAREGAAQAERVAGYLAKGLTIEQVAEEMGVSKRTVFRWKGLVAA